MILIYLLLLLVDPHVAAQIWHWAEHHTAAAILIALVTL